MRIWYTTPPRVGVRNFRNTTDPPPLSLRYSGGGRSLSGGGVSVGSPPGAYQVHTSQERKRISPDTLFPGILTECPWVWVRGLEN